MLELPGDGEGGKDEAEDEDVVDGERVLDDVARQVLDGRRRPPNDEEADPEEERQGDPDARLCEGFAGRDDVGLAMEDSEIEGQGADDEDEKSGAEDEGWVEIRNRVPPGRRVEGLSLFSRHPRPAGKAQPWQAEGG